MSCGGLTSTFIIGAIIYFIVKMVIKANASKSSQEPMDRPVDDMSRMSRRERKAADDARKEPVQVNPRSRWASDRVVVEAQQDDSRDRFRSGAREVSFTAETPEPERGPSVIVDPSGPPPPAPPPPALAGDDQDARVVAEAEAADERTDSAEADHADESGEPVAAEQLLETLAARGPLNARAEDEVEDRWRGRGVFGRGEVVMAQQVYGTDLDFDVSEGTKVTLTIDLPGEAQLLSPRVLLLVGTDKPARAVSPQQKVDFQGRVRGYRSIVRTLLVENAEVRPSEN